MRQWISNSTRKARRARLGDLPPTKLGAMARVLLPDELKKAKQRQCHHRGKTSEGSALDIVAASLVLSRHTLARILRVLDQAEKDPARFGDLPARMDAGTVNAAYRELCRRELGPKRGHLLFNNIKIGRAAIGDLTIDEMWRIHEIVGKVVLHFGQSSSGRVRDVISPDVLRDIVGRPHSGRKRRKIKKA